MPVFLGFRNSVVYQTTIEVMINLVMTNLNSVYSSMFFRLGDTVNGAPVWARMASTVVSDAISVKVKPFFGSTSNTPCSKPSAAQYSTVHKWVIRRL